MLPFISCATLIKSLNIYVGVSFFHDDAVQQTATDSPRHVLLLAGGGLWVDCNLASLGWTLPGTAFFF